MGECCSCDKKSYETLEQEINTNPRKKETRTRSIPSISQKHSFHGKDETGADTLEGEESEEMEGYSNNTEEWEKIFAAGMAEFPKEVQRVLGDFSEYSVPKSLERRKLERDLRKLKNHKNISKDHKWYTEIIILKHYSLLADIFTSYCKIGGDADWMNLSGWMAMITDGYIASKTSDVCKRRDCRQLFQDIYCSHHVATAQDVEVKSESDDINVMGIMRSPTHSRIHTAAFGKMGRFLSDDLDPWTGIWEEENSLDHERYIFKHVGDRKLIGCVNTVNYCEISGALGNVDHTKAKMRMKWNGGRRAGSIRRIDCELFPPDQEGRFTINVQWTSVTETSKKGHYKLFKIDQLTEEIEDMFTLGLARHEFYDGLLQLGLMKFPDLPQYHALDKLITEHLREYCWHSDPLGRKSSNSDRKKHRSKESKKRRKKLKRNGAALRKLFGTYSALDTSMEADEDSMEMEEFLVFVNDLMDIPPKHVFHNGGKPTKAQIIGVYNLCTPKLETRLAYVNFEKSLEILPLYVFRKKPNAKYPLRDLDSKFQKIVEWCLKLQKRSSRPDPHRIRRLKTADF